MDKTTPVNKTLLPPGDIELNSRKKANSTGNNTKPYKRSAIKDYMPDQVSRQVTSRSKHLKQGVAYTLEEIYSHPRWRKLDPGERKMAGIYMHELVKQHRVPFIVAETEHEYPKKYYLISR